MGQIHKTVNNFAADLFSRQTVYVMMSQQLNTAYNR